MLGGFHAEVALLRGGPGWTRTNDVSTSRIYSPLQSPLCILTHIWWNRPGLNQRRTGLQPVALPAELRFHMLNWSKSTSLDFGVDDGNRTRDRRNHNPLPYRLATSTMIGADRGARTPDPRLKRALLYQLSYVRVFGGARRTRI